MDSTNTDDWLCLCTPLSCFHGNHTNASFADIIRTLFTGENELNIHTYDHLQNLKFCYDELNSSKVDIIETQIKFIKRCIHQDNKIIQIIVDGISRGIDFERLIRSIEPLITNKSCGPTSLVRSNLNDLLLSDYKGLKTSELVQIVKGKLEDNLIILEKQHKIITGRNQQLNQIMLETIENWRNEYFDVITRKFDEKINIGNKLSKSEFKKIINTNNNNWFNLIFDYVDEDCDGLIDWNQFELQLENILQML